MIIDPNKAILCVDKPVGWTSFDVVAKVRGRLSGEYRRQFNERRKIKVGHTGTLDPFATGLLVLAVGKATKDIQGMMKADKVYEVTTQLGWVSTTGDPEGEITKQASFEQLAQITEADTCSVAAQFVGEIEQTPPKYSAIKVNGKRAYDLARAGKEFTLEPRPVMIHELTIESINPETGEMKLTAHVGSGTYIRTLVEDIGKQLGCGAYTTALRRTKVGNFDISGAISVDQINDLCYS